MIKLDGNGTLVKCWFPFGSIKLSPPSLNVRFSCYDKHVKLSVDLPGVWISKCLKGTR